MAHLVKITGLNAVFRNMNKADSRLGAAVARGLIRGGRYLQRVSQLIVPVMTGDLKGSADTRNVGGSGFKTDIAVSYNTDYAVKVHEDLQARHKPGKTAKYLEKPAREKKNEIISIINEEAKRI